MKAKLLLTALCLIISFSAFSANNYDCQIDGICYNLDHNKHEASVTYRGKNSYKGNVTIPEKIVYNNTTYTVTSIGRVAFAYCRKLTSVVLPNTISSIGNNAFSICESLSSINLPPSLSVIGSEAFKGCTSLVSIDLPNSVTEIKDLAFEYCSSLRSVRLPSSLKSISFRTFEYCTSLSEVVIPDGVTEIKYAAFEYCTSIKSIDIPNSVTKFDQSVFRGCDSLKSVRLSNNLKTISAWSFYGCDALTEVSIPFGVTEIGEHAFSFCKSLETIALPNSIEYIGNSAFSSCSSLTSITIPASVKSTGSEIFAYDYALKTIRINCRKFDFSSLKIISGNPNHRAAEILLTPDFIGEIPQNYYSRVKYVAPEESFEEYCAANPFTSWDDFYAGKRTKKAPQFSAEDISRRISDNIEAWQKKGEYESTAQWSARVNEQTRAHRIDSLKSIYVSTAKKEQADYLAEREEIQREYEQQYKVHYEKLRNHYVYLHTSVKERAFKKDFALNSPYDADHQSFLINSETYGDILLPVPVADAPAFKNNWENIKQKIKPTFAFNGKEAVLSKLTFTNGSKEYVYDSHTDAKYAVADIEYNFAPLDIAATDFDIESITVDAPVIAQAAPTMTVSKTGEAPALDKKKVTVEKTAIKVGNGAKRPDVDTNIPRGSRKADKTFALIIANENYRREGTVPYAINDGTMVAEYLKNTVGIPEQNIQLYTDASLNDIKFGINKLRQICDAFGSEASVIVYYAGHGIPDESSREAYLLPVDGFGSDPSTGYAVNELYATLGALPAHRTLLMLDACFSGSQRSGAMLATNARGVRIKPRAAGVDGNLIVLSATQSDETAYPYEDMQHGLFTYFMLKKLNETKGDVNLGDLADYIITNVKKTSILTNDKMQTPTVNASPAQAASWQNVRLGD